MEYSTIHRTVPEIQDLDFFRQQQLIVLRNRGKIDPDSIEEYIANGGYEALVMALSEQSPE
ncbi:hypothetical protein GF337_04625, partial [candidate division KSB1 bacterium]|nr:hypothetical protein [candidate division KSB1 bacterium]